jgi:DNA-binding MarR family transcriptional regulator
MRVLWAVDHALQRVSKRMARIHGVTGPQRLTLRMLGAFPGSSAGELAELLHLDPSTLTGILQRLEERGLVERSPDPDDARRVRLELTAKGYRLDVPLRDTVESALRAALGSLPEARIKATRDTLATIAASLEVAAEGGAPSKRRGNGSTSRRT